MELDHLVLADVISPRPDGKLDLFGVGWDTIFAASVPANHPRMDLAVRFLLSRHEVQSAHQVVLTLVDEDGAELARMDSQIGPLKPEQYAELPAGRKLAFAALLTLASVVFPRFGAYQLVLTWDGNELREPMRLYVAPTADAGTLAA